MAFVILSKLQTLFYTQFKVCVKGLCIVVRHLFGAERFKTIKSTTSKTAQGENGQGFGNYHHTCHVHQTDYGPVHIKSYRICRTGNIDFCRYVHASPSYSCLMHLHIHWNEKMSLFIVFYNSKCCTICIFCKNTIFPIKFGKIRCFVSILLVISSNGHHCHSF